MTTVDSFPATSTYVGNGDGVPNFNLTPQQIESISSEYINGSMMVHDTVAAQSTPTFDNCIIPIATYDNSTREAVGVVSFLKYVSTDKAVRAASTAATDAINKHCAEMYMRKDVYNSVCAVHQDAKEMSQLQEEDTRLVEYMMETFHSYGNGLDQDKAKRFSQIYSHLDQLISQHSQNAIEITNHVLFTREELDGLPESYFDGRLTETIDGVDKFVVTTKNPDYGPVMRFAKNPETRKSMLVAFNSRCHMNIPILQEAVDLRREMAHILGYRTHAEGVLSDQMAETPEAVLAMLGEVRGAFAGFHKVKVDELTELKKQDMGDKPFDGFFDWDLGYYGRIFAETTYSYDAEDAKQYFPVEHVVGAILNIFKNMLGLQISKIDRAETVWHPDVEVFEVREAHDATKLVGYFCLDLYSREGKLNNSAQYPVSDGYVRPDGTRHPPVSALMTNFSRPQGSASALLLHSEVNTLMHEIGHVFHHLCARTKWSIFHYGKLERDFIEVPSKMLENWSWQPEVLKQISKHHVTGLALPDDKIQQLVDLRRVYSQFGNIGVVFIALYDMAIHNSSSHVDVLQTFVEMSKEIVCSDQGSGEMVPKLGNITHLMSGYDARYYSYLWSEVCGADMFASRFLKEGLDNPQTGMDYRTEVLQPGASRPAHISIAQFLGRKPNSAAFFSNSK